MNNEQLTFVEKQECFNAFMEEYKAFSLVDKQKIVIDELKELIGLFQNIGMLQNIKTELIVNREIIDVNKDNYSQEDFAEAVYAYLQMYKEILADFMLPMFEELPNTE